MTPSATSVNASRSKANARRLATNPGVSFLTSAGARPSFLQYAFVRSSVVCEVAGEGTSSSNGIMCGGL